MSHPLEYMTDLWPRFFTDLVVVCRVRAVSRAFSAAALDFSAASMLMYGDKIEDGVELEVVNHKYCGKKCADSLIGGAELSHCNVGHIIQITIHGGIILTKYSQPRHFARPSYECTTILAAKHLYADDRRAHLSWKKLKMLRYDVEIGGVSYRSNAPGALLEQILGAFIDISIEYY